MKCVAIAFLAALSFFTCFSQHTTTVMYDGRGNVIGGNHIRIPQGKPVNIIDSASGVTFTDPWKDNHIPVYRTNRPVIVDFKFEKTDFEYNKIPKGTKVLWIVYLNTQFGYLDLATGKYNWMGQD